MKTALLLALLIAGCGAPLHSVSTGERAAPPAGYITYCAEHPKAVQCGGTKP